MQGRIELGRIIRRCDGDARVGDRDSASLAQQIVKLAGLIERNGC